MKTHSTKKPAVTAKGFEIEIMLAPSGAISWLAGRSKALCTTVMMLGLLACVRDAHSQAADAPGRARFEPASALVSGCTAAKDGNYSFYQMQIGGKWVKMQSDVAARLAVSLEGNALTFNKNGQILHWNGSKFVENAAGGCAIKMGVEPNLRGLTNGTPWTVGCTPQPGPLGNFNVYQTLTGGEWDRMQGYAAVGTATSPEANPWTITWAQPL